MPPRKKKVPTIERDENGLISKPKVEYHFNEDGSVNWRKMIDPKWLYANPSSSTQETDVAKLRDRDLCILLGGIKELAQLRGYTSVDYDVTASGSEYVVAKCVIKWIPNFETEGNEISFSSIGDSSLYNTAPAFGVYYLGPTAENRAFVRCVRNFLKINIVSKEEILERKGNNHYMQQSGGNDAYSLLERVMKEKNLTLEGLKGKLKTAGIGDPENYETIKDIPKQVVFSSIGIVKSF
jgi:hypothetical protein